MPQRMIVAIGILLTMVAGSGSVHAQWGYGYYPYGYGGYGWGGWGSTVQGNVATGLGYFNMGAGIYNEETAAARSINTDTMMRWNQYVYESQQEATREYYSRRDANLTKDRKAYDAMIKRVRENPTESEINNGDALNASLDQLSDPRIHSSVLHMAEGPVDAKLVQDIPFRNAAEAASFSLSQLRDSSKWPAVLMDQRFEGERAEFQTAVDEVRKDVSDDSQVEQATLTRLRDVASKLKAKLTAKPLENKADNQEAIRFVKTVTALARLLGKPEIEQVLAELKKMDHTSIGNLLAFMHTFNLRFGPAVTPKQKLAYGQLYPTIRQTRDKILSEIKLDESTKQGGRQGHAGDFFSGMDLEHMEGRNKKATPPPPPSQP